MLFIYEILAQCALWSGHYSDAQKSAAEAMNFSQPIRDEVGMTSCGVVRGYGSSRTGQSVLSQRNACSTP